MMAFQSPNEASNQCRQSYLQMPGQAHLVSLLACKFPNL